jgi:hypothetical protein
MALEGNLGGRRRKSRPRKMWLDDVQGDIIKMDVDRWRIKTTGRGEWRKIFEAAKVLQELFFMPSCIQNKVPDMGKCEISDFHGGEYEDGCLPGCCASQKTVVFMGKYVSYNRRGEVYRSLGNI